MKIKLAIIITILAIGGILFSTELLGLFPENSSKLVDSFLNSNLIQVKETTEHTVGGRIGSTINTIEKGMGGTIQSVSSNIENFKDDSVSAISDGIDKISSLGKITKEESEKTETVEKQSNPKTESSNLQAAQPSITTIDNSKTQTITFDTLSLTTAKQSDDRIKLHYEDTSGKTISVKVTLRTNEKELFSGIFYSSMFETFVGNSLNTPYFIEMEVEHELHGTISSSVFNPGDSPDVLINGIFTKS